MTTRITYPRTTFEAGAAGMRRRRKPGKEVAYGIVPRDDLPAHADGLVLCVRPFGVVVYFNCLTSAIRQVRAAR
jgi:hypothetical protein